MQEQEFFSSENVFVSNSRFVAFGQTYAMSGVTSVKAAEVQPSQLSTILFFAIGLVLVLLGIAGVVAALVLGIALVIIAAVLGSQKRPSYYVCLTISSGEVRAVQSQSREYIEQIVQALNDCIVARG